MRFLHLFIKFNQFFKNANGIKAFAEQTMNWLLNRTLKTSRNPISTNKVLTENIKLYKEDLEKRNNYTTIDPDEYSSIKAKIIAYSLIIAICIIGETFFNYFASKAIFTFRGWLGEIAAMVFAVLLTWMAISLFESLIREILIEPSYKSENKNEQRNYGKIIMLSLFAIIYEVLIFYISKVRGIQIEGGSGNGIISSLMLMAGMLMPAIAGFYSYEKSKYVDAYKNTNKIAYLKNTISKAETKIQKNNSKIEGKFNEYLQFSWANLQEFKAYKENYNLKHNVPIEDLKGHFSENQDTYRDEANKRRNLKNSHVAIYDFKNIAN